MAAELHRTPSDSSSSSLSSSSPVLGPADSTAALIFINDDDDETAPLDFSSDSDDETLEQQYEVRRSSILPLSPSDAFLYLLAPYLRLGALLIPNSQLDLKFGLPPLFVFAFLAAFSRQILYMLSRYLKKTDLEDVVLDAFARGRGKEKRRAALRSIVRATTGITRVLLAATYLRESAEALLPFSTDLNLPTRPVLIAVLGVAVIPFATSQSLASRKVVYATWFSLVAFVAWLGCVSYAYNHGDFEANPDTLQLGAFWQGIPVTAFAFCSSSTLPLYATLRAASQPISIAAGRQSRSRSFRIISPLTVAIALLMILPLVLFSAHSIIPATGFPYTREQTPSAPLPEDPHDHHIPAIHAFKCLVLLSGIPSILAIIPPVPIPRRTRNSINFSLSKVIIFISVVLLALAPEEVSSRSNDVLLLPSLAGTYFLPALLHVTIHFFKRPLSIVIPQTPVTPAISNLNSAAGSPYLHNDGLIPHTSRPRLHDELLQRKERALQKKQLRKRIIWDIGVWLLLLVSVSGFSWGVGRLAHQW